VCSSDLVPRHSTPWVMDPPPPIDDDVWELYAPDDWTQAHDVAAQQPERLAYLQRLFLIEAAKNNVLPLDDRRIERFNSDLAGRPNLVRGDRQMLYEGMMRLSESSVANLKNKSHAVTAQIAVPEGRTPDGVLIAQGGSFGGWALYVRDGIPAYCYNLFGLRRFKVYGENKIPSGEHQVRAEVAYDGADSVRVEPYASSSTARASATVASTRQSRWSSRPTRQPTSGPTPRHR